jgi:hypothetical protein
LGVEDPNADRWEKGARIDVPIPVPLPHSVGAIETAGRETVAAKLSSIGFPGLAAEVRAEIEAGRDGPELVLTVVNVSPEELDGFDTSLYEVELEADVGPIQDFVLDGLPESFRYDRHVPAFGVNGGVERLRSTRFVTSDAACCRRRRPGYWDDALLGTRPVLTFDELSKKPVEGLAPLVDALSRWTSIMWSDKSLSDLAARRGWDGDMLQMARHEADRAAGEVARVDLGLQLLDDDETLRRAFSLANRSFARTPSIEHHDWRPFQLGFVLANLAAIVDPKSPERDVVDTLWFATGGGKTETYLLYVLVAAFHDRLTGKLDGITSWARFPLRMLSLQQTQRFADVFAAAELVRREEGIAGAQFSIGFLVGEGGSGSPNRVSRIPRAGQPDPKVPADFVKYRVLIRCPFCLSRDLHTTFDTQRWALDHVCQASKCPWGGRPLPFRIVDDEIYRWLPTVVLGTLDKAANIAMQASMRGFYGAPSGVCGNPEHGFTYAVRGDRPNGCLYPDCRERVKPLGQAAALFPPSVRMQDELHLLRDSLGAVDSHYEALLDGLQQHWGSSPKLIASSATLSGHDEQVAALYRRSGRMFPIPGPASDRSFWSVDSVRLARSFVGLAPRGVTLEYANDQLTETLQKSVRRALTSPAEVAVEAGVDAGALPALVWAYGVDVVYGSTLKDVEAAARSFDAQIPIEKLNWCTMTGRTPLDEVRTVLQRLADPEADFDDRIHLVAASSMLSHGVDLDRLNVMVMLGLPLSTAEFIQTTARVGRKYPGLVFVLHKIARERDAGVFRSFPSFIEHMDRLVDPVPITSRSRRVLQLTFSGLEQGRIYGIHEPEALARQLKQLTKPGTLKRAFTVLGVTEDKERDAITAMLRFEGPLDENLRADLRDYVRQFFRNLYEPGSSAEWVSELFPTGEPMRSLRDVEAQVPIYSKGGPS